MRWNKGLFTGMMLFGAGLAALSLLLGDRVENAVGGMLMGVGSGLFAMGLANLLRLHRAEKNPRQMKQEEIEANDERNVAIRRRAQAVAGEVLQWSVMAAAWISIGFGAPLWVTLTAVGVFIAKSVLELCLMVRYQREM